MEIYLKNNLYLENYPYNMQIKHSYLFINIKKNILNKILILLFK